ncbi:MAG: phage tail sheath family protein [Lachnospiraceae bacterium]|nr:phage tail sheath family protein [Lachnospiraceae bacterium]
MAEYLSPGVYVEEFESGSKPMEGVGTSTAGFVGLAERGPVEGLPQLVTNVSDFRRTYGGYLSRNEFEDYRFLAYAVESFFVNGGSRCFVMRVAPKDAKCSEGYAPSKENPMVVFSAKNPGIWGDDIRISITPAAKAKTQILEILNTPEGKKYRAKNSAGFNPGDVVAFLDKGETIHNKVVRNQDNILTFEKDFPDQIVDTNLLPVKVVTTCEVTLEVRYQDITETYENVSFNISASNFIEKMTAKSDLITVSYNPADSAPAAKAAPEAEGDKKNAKKSAPAADEKAISPPAELLGVSVVSLTGGSNGSVSNISAADFIGEDNGAGKRSGIQAFVDNDVVSIMAVPGVTDPNVQLTLVAHCENLTSRFAVLDIPRDARKVQDVAAHRDMFDSEYAALYHPWLEVFDPLDKKNIMIPPSGAMLGIYARSDNSRGVHKAPANEVVRACVGLDCQFNKGEQDILNPKGVNLIRSFPGQGIRVWGARTVSSNGSWKYVNVRRLFIFIEESIKANTSWAVFEPNDETLWVRVQRTISVFLTNLWRNGSLAGSSPEEAFFVNIGRNTMSQDDIDNGRLICVIGAAPVKPAEFVIFRITQKTNESAE